MEQESARRELLEKILPGVSRSFVLTLRLLPPTVRPTISLAYLLARASDTIADTGGIPAAERADLLRRFRQVLDGKEDSSLFGQLSGRIAPQCENASEAELMRKVSAAVRWFQTLPRAPWESTRRVLDRIMRAQILDTERFPDDRQIRFLASGEELEEYAYLVAGCVGEFWTEQLAVSAPNALQAPASDMSRLGTEYGKGLQLVNILRDLPRDLAAGRCYLPCDEIEALGIDPESVGKNPAPILAAAVPWMHRCADALDAGAEYIARLKGERLRYATALPLFLGARTLALLRKASWQDLERRVKISRLGVRLIMLRAAPAVSSARSMRRLYASLKGGD